MTDPLRDHFLGGFYSWRKCVLLGPTITSEAAAAAALRSAHRSRACDAWIVAMATGLLCGLVFTDVADRTAAPLAFLALVATLSALLGIACVVSLVDSGQVIAARQPLSASPALGRALLALADQSPAVAGYVHAVNQSGRELRIFDYPCAYQAFQTEQARAVSQLDATTMARLRQL